MTNLELYRGNLNINTEMDKISEIIKLINSLIKSNDLNIIIWDYYSIKALDDKEKNEFISNLNNKLLEYYIVLLFSKSFQIICRRNPFNLSIDFVINTNSEIQNQLNKLLKKIAILEDPTFDESILIKPEEVLMIQRTESQHDLIKLKITNKIIKMIEGSKYIYGMHYYPLFKFN